MHCFVIARIHFYEKNKFKGIENNGISPCESLKHL